MHEFVANLYLLSRRALLRRGQHLLEYRGGISNGHQAKRSNMAAPTVPDTAREKALTDYRKKLLEHKELESRLKESKLPLLIRNITSQRRI